jgi:hypothetical protein
LQLDHGLLTSSPPIPAPPRNTDGWILFLFIETFVMATLLLSLLLSTFFINAKLASACAGIFYFCLYGFAPHPALLFLPLSLPWQ